MKREVSDKVLNHVGKRPEDFYVATPDQLVIELRCGNYEIFLLGLLTGINKYFDIVQADFEIFGQTQSEWEGYVKGKNYEAFVIRRKNLNLDYEKHS